MYNRAQNTSVNDIDILKNILSQERFSLKTFFGSEFENESAIGNNLKEKIQNEFNSSYQTLLTRFKNYKNAWLLHIDTVETYRIILTLRNFDKMDYIRRILQKTAKLTIQIADNQSDDKNSILSGDIVKTASFVIDSLSKKTIVTIELNGQSASDWKNITEKNIGEKFSLNLDGYSYATFPIESVNNTVIIKFEYKNNLDVSVINAVLNSGSYKAPFQIIEERRFCND